MALLLGYDVGRSSVKATPVEAETEMVPMIPCSREKMLGFVARKTMIGLCISWHHVVMILFYHVLCIICLQPFVYSPCGLEAESLAQNRRALRFQHCVVFIEQTYEQGPLDKSRLEERNPNTIPLMYGIITTIATVFTLTVLFVRQAIKIAIMKQEMRLKAYVDKQLRLSRVSQHPIIIFSQSQDKTTGVLDSEIIFAYYAISETVGGS